MKTWKIITIATLAVVAAALLVSSVAAMGPFGYNANTGYGGMMGRGGMMGEATDTATDTATNHTQPNTNSINTILPTSLPIHVRRNDGPIMANGFGGMMRGYGYTAPYTYNWNTTKHHHRKNNRPKLCNINRQPRLNSQTS